MTADREPQTKTGRELRTLLARITSTNVDYRDTILAIEAEAREQGRDLEADECVGHLTARNRDAAAVSYSFADREPQTEAGRETKRIFGSDLEANPVPMTATNWDACAAAILKAARADAAPPPAGIDVERLREAVWNANRENGWAEAVDRTTHMANQIATEYARLTSQPLEGAKLADARIEQLQDLVRRLTECLHPAMTTGGRPCACQTHADARAGLQVDNPHG